MPARGMGRGMRPTPKRMPGVKSQRFNPQQQQAARPQAPQTPAPQAAAARPDATQMESQRQAAMSAGMTPQSQVANRPMSPQAATSLAALRPMPGAMAPATMGRAGMPITGGAPGFSPMAPAGAMGQAAAARGAMVPPTQQPPGAAPAANLALAQRQAALQRGLTS